MRKMIFTLVLGVAGLAQAQGKAEVPGGFVGTWKASLQYCRSHDDDSILKITRRELHYFEAGGAVVKVSGNWPARHHLTGAHTRRNRRCVSAERALIAVCRRQALNRAHRHG